MKLISGIIFINSILIFCFFSCIQSPGKSRHKRPSDSDIQKGKTLALKYCQSCHQFPDPSYLNADTWVNGVLPRMGPRLGIFQYNQKNYPYNRHDMEIPRDFYPSKPALSDEEWQRIIDYYSFSSPDSMQRQIRKYSIKGDLTLFTPFVSSFKYYSPGVSFVKIDTARQLQPVIIADATKKMLYRFDKDLNIHDSVITKKPLVDLYVEKSRWISCNIGVLSPNNGKYGNAGEIMIQKDGKLKEADSPIFDGLQRPVQIIPADFNKDGKEDFLVCEFGFLTGSLSWMENIGDGKFSKHILRALPGAIKAYIRDVNKDSLPDLWVLFAQGEEGIFLFTNKGNGQFSESEVLRFPPFYGSSYFEFADFNNDGHEDILYTCGDNADYSVVLKPFHGIYIYINDGSNHFEQKYFFPINGCYKAMARDYDNDGDLDIASISFFPDFINQPEEGFVYLENKGNYDFMPYSLPITQQGRWLTIDAGDFDHDGKIDLLLGNFSVAPQSERSKIDWRNSPPFILLKNLGLKN